MLLFCLGLVLHFLGIDHEDFPGHHLGIFPIDRKHNLNSNVPQRRADTLLDLAQRLVSEMKMQSELPVLGKNLGQCLGRAFVCTEAFIHDSSEVQSVLAAPNRLSLTESIDDYKNATNQSTGRVANEPHRT
jgi:hypothetical protein